MTQCSSEIFTVQVGTSQHSYIGMHAHTRAHAAEFLFKWPSFQKLHQAGLCQKKQPRVQAILQAGCHSCHPDSSVKALKRGTATNDKEYSTNLSSNDWSKYLSVNLTAGFLDCIPLAKSTSTALYVCLMSPNQLVYCTTCTHIQCLLQTTTLL